LKLDPNTVLAGDGSDLKLYKKRFSKACDVTITKDYM
jgi:hypothetical protein